MSTTRKSVLTILGLILATTAALAAMESMTSDPVDKPPIHATGEDERVTVTTEVVQDKLLKGGDGRVTVALNLAAAQLPAGDHPLSPATDLVIVLDRSGSMQGRKLNDARLAITRLMNLLGPDDRLSLITYASDVRTLANLQPVDTANRERLRLSLMRVSAGGGTNLSGGLGRGIDLVRHTPPGGRQRRVILISDGLANQGITDPVALGRMAETALAHRFSISTVGVGLEFNEIVMTAIADRGAGNYRFLEDPHAFASVFEAELIATRQVAASDVAIRIPLNPGVRLTDAGGYPIHMEGDTAVVHPGDLLSGQHRSFYLTFQVPATVEKEVVLGQLQMHYRHASRSHTVDSDRPMRVACVSDPTAVIASINRDAWEEQVVREDFSRLKEAVAADIRDGDAGRANARIHAYESRQSAINSVVGSAKVTHNLETEVTALRDQVDDTFAGAPAAVAEKKKQAAKALQYEGYKMRRSKN